MCNFQAKPNENKLQIPEHSVGGAAGLEGDAVAHLMTDVHVHLVGHSQGQLHRALSVDLSADYHAVLVLHRQAELCAPLWDL